MRYIYDSQTGEEASRSICVKHEENKVSCLLFRRGLAKEIQHNAVSLSTDIILKAIHL